MSGEAPIPSAESGGDDAVASALWRRVLDDWTDDKRHEVFVAHCQSEGNLARAAAAYRARLEELPDTDGDVPSDERAIAERQLQRITALAFAQISLAQEEQKAQRDNPSRGVRVMKGLVYVLALFLLAATVHALRSAL